MRANTKMFLHLLGDMSMFISTGGLVVSMTITYLAKTILHDELQKVEIPIVKKHQSMF